MPFNLPFSPETTHFLLAAVILALWLCLGAPVIARLVLAAERRHGPTPTRRRFGRTRP